MESGQKGVQIFWVSLEVLPQTVSLTLGSRLDLGQCAGTLGSCGLFGLVSGQSTVSLSVQ